MKGFLGEILGKEECVTIFCDSKSELCLMKNSMYYERTKHIDIKLHFIRDVVASGKVVVKKIDTKKNHAYALTKVIPTEKLNKSIELVQVVNAEAQEDERVVA